MTQNLDTVLAYIDDHFDESVARLTDFLRIPSISTDPDYAQDTRRAAEWARDQLSEIGFDCSVRDTPGHPMVVAHSGTTNLRVVQNGDEHTPSAHRSESGGTSTGPHLLYYGHYDVQPPDPLELWDSPPFEPTIVDSPHGKKIVARGAVDDKGQLMLFVEAFRAWKETHGELPARVSIILEGEEESGSPSLEPFLEANKDELAADVCIVSDTGMWNVDTPAITTMLRGLVYVEVTLSGPAMDLHSGMFGGAVANPCNDLCAILAQLKDDNNIVQIPGFYDDVEEVSAEVQRQWDTLDFDEAQFLAEAGMRTPRGEHGKTTLQRIWSRPTCDINGIFGGYTGQGAKTVIAAKCTVKLSCRLVPSQNPDAILAGIKQFFEDRVPPDCRIEVESHGISPAISVPAGSPFIEAAARGMAHVYENEAALIGCGGSIPLVGSVQRILGFDSLLVGFGLDDDCMHSPNEKFELTCYKRGIKSHAAMLMEFARVHDATPA